MNLSSGATNNTPAHAPSQDEAPSKYIFKTPELYTSLLMFSSFSVQFSSIHTSKSSSIDKIQFLNPDRQYKQGSYLGSVDQLLLTLTSYLCTSV